MTAAVIDLDVVLEQSRKHVASQDVWRDQVERHQRVRHLTSIGASAEEIAQLVGLSDRHVVRLRSAQERAAVPHVPAPRDITAERACEVEELAQRAFEWAGVLRDEDPVIVFEALNRLPRQRLLEFVMVALAMVPSDATLTELLGWVLALPAAREEA